MAELLRGQLRFAAEQPHILWGVSVEDKKFGVPRIDDLRQSGAAVKFLSIEPLLEDLGPINLTGINWVIVGGESGPGARPIHPDWVKSLRDQAEAAGVAFFFKQWGGTRKKETGCLLDGLEYKAYPFVQTCPTASRETRTALITELELAG
jgi:protein gp37